MITQENKVTLAEMGLTVDDLRDTSGHYRVLSLFVENKKPKYPAYWTYRDIDFVKDGILYKSLTQTFMDCEDPTGYKFAMKVFGSWNFYKRLRRSKELQQLLFNKWDEELEVRLMSKGIKGIVKEAQSGKNALSASKFLVDRGWLPKEENKGRPNKKKIQQEANKLIRIHDELDEELIRAEQLIN